MSRSAAGLQFVPQGTRGGADFANIGAIELEIDTTQNATDGGITQLLVRGPSDQSFNFLNAAPALDADAIGTGPTVLVGQTVTFLHRVSNLGNTPIASVRVLDDDGTPSETTDDFFAALASGDTNANALLDVTETWTFSASRVATLGDYRNTALATGQDSLGNPAMDTDSNHQRGVILFS